MVSATRESARIMIVTAHNRAAPGKRVLEDFVPIIAGE